MTMAEARSLYRQIETYQYREAAVTALAWKRASDWRLFELADGFAIGRPK